MKQNISTITAIVAFLLTITSQANAEKRISLLSSTPSENEIYTAWGHTAIRVLDSETGTDIAFNYGVFDFNELGTFIYRFVTGETDYKLGVESMNRAIRSAHKKNCTLYEQTLNLTQEEATAITDALWENAKPENTYYRYNFFYNNCATKARDIIENTCGGIDYANFNKKITYRQIIHERLANMPWYAFGIDICLGSPTDELVRGKNITFLPIELKEAFSNAKRKDGSNLIRETTTICAPDSHNDEANSASLPSPTLCCWILLLLVIAHTIYYTKKKKNDSWFDIALFSLSGVIGLLVCFLAFISEHPCTNPNYNLLWANPLHLIMAISLPLFSKNAKITTTLAKIIGIGAIAAIILWKIIPQEYNSAFLPLMIIIAIRSFVIIKRKKNLN